MADVLIENATLITMDADRRMIEDGAVAIEGDRIVAVGPTDEVKAGHSARQTIDGRRKVVMPPLVDLYGHVGGGIIKCLGDQLGGDVWRDLLDDIGFRFATERFWYVDAQLNALERLKAGTTMSLTMPGVSSPRMDNPVYVKQLQKAFEDLGVRARVVIGPARPPWPQPYADYRDGQRVQRDVSFEEILENCDAVFAESRRNPSRLVDYMTGTSRFGNANPMDPMWKPEHEQWSRRQAEGLRALMDTYDVGYWCHAYGNAIEYAYDQQLGLLGSKTILSHCSGISQRTIEILAETGTRVNHNPRARRLYTYREPCPVIELLEAGVIIGIGSDGPQPDRAADNFLDVKAAMNLQRHRFGSQSVFPPGKALEMATIDAHRALNTDGSLGSLEVGKKADLIVLDAFKPHLWPLSVPAQQVAYYATGADVEHVFVDGQHVLAERRATRIDEAALLEEAASELDRLMAIPELRLQELTRAPAMWGHARG